MQETLQLLFSKHELSHVLDNNIKKATQEVDSIPKSQFIISSEDDILEHVFSELQVLLLELYEDNKEIEPKETEVDVKDDPLRGIRNRGVPCLVPGFEISVTIPFSGDAILWLCKPTTYDYNPPNAVVHPSRDNESGYIEMVYTVPSDRLDDKELKTRLNDNLARIEKYIGNVNINVNAHNERLFSHIKHCITQRRIRLGKQEAVLKALNIPLSKKASAPDISVLPMKKRIVRPLPSKPKTPAEPGITDEDYEYILKVIRHEGKTFETTPRTYAKHDEEELRDILVAHLNGHYDGQATGETFRVAGKTDIIIEDKDRSAFIAECKIWRGKAGLHDAIDQLLGYLTWRDCKTALVIFNKDISGFSAIQNKLPTEITEHTNVVNEIPNQDVGEWRFRLRSKEDKDRYIILHVFLFDLYES